ncbi:MAG: MBL fold metallo-hydrolase [Pseudomonadota bacterium]
MRITCWGSRGSIPVSGEQYIRYGGDTTCLEIRTRSNDIIIVDAGTGIRSLGNHLLAEERFSYHFIFTHAHWDHVMGFPFFKPIFYPESRFVMHRCPFASKFVDTVLKKVMSPPNFPVKYSEIKAELVHEDACPLDFEIGSVSITPIPLSHPNGGSGYKFTEDGKSFVFLTDNELGFAHPNGRTREDYLAFCQGADFLIHDAEYTAEEYKNTIEWGHTVYTEALALAMDAGVRQFGLFHLNQERTDDQVDAMVDDCRRIIASAGVDMTCFAVGTGTTVEL